MEVLIIIIAGAVLLSVLCILCAYRSSGCMGRRVAKVLIPCIMCLLIILSVIGLDNKHEDSPDSPTSTTVVETTTRVIEIPTEVITKPGVGDLNVSDDVEIRPTTTKPVGVDDDRVEISIDAEGDKVYHVAIDLSAGYLTQRQYDIFANAAVDMYCTELNKSGDIYSATWRYLTSDELNEQGIKSYYAVQQDTIRISMYMEVKCLTDESLSRSGIFNFRLDSKGNNLKLAGWEVSVIE